MQPSLAEQYTILHNYNFVHSFLVVIEHEDLLCSLLESVLKAATDLLLTQHHHLIRLGEDPFSCEPFHQVSFSLDNTLTREQSKGGDIGWRSVQRLKVINVHLFFFYFLLDFQFLKLFGTLSRRVKVSQSYKVILKYYEAHFWPYKQNCHWRSDLMTMTSYHFLIQYKHSEKTNSNPLH